MILSIPYQALQIGNIHLSPFQTDKYGKAISKMTYNDSSINCYDVSILSPPLTVLNYNSENSKLVLDLGEQFNFAVKLNTLQEYLVSTFFVHQHSFLYNTNYTHDNIRNLFHFLLHNNYLTLYVFPNMNVKKEDGTVIKITNLAKGDTIRCIIRFQGISQINTRHGIKLRLQHSIASLWLISSTNDATL